MAKLFDYIALTIICFLLTLTLSSLFLPNWTAVLIFSVTSSLLVSFTTFYFQKGKNKPYSSDCLLDYFCIKGNKFAISHIASVLNYDIIDNTFNAIITKNLILAAYFKFSVLSVTELNALVEFAKLQQVNTLFIMTEKVDRHAFRIIDNNEIKLQIVKIKAVYKFLKNNNALPIIKNKKYKIQFSEFFATIFNRKNTKFYIFSATTLLVFAYFTPLKIYYIVFGSLSLLMAILTLTPLGKGSFKNENVFNKIKNENIKSPNSDDKSKEPSNNDSSENQ